MSRKQTVTRAKAQASAKKSQELATGEVFIRENDPKYQYWINQLRSNAPLYNRIKGLFVDSDLAYFEHKWAEYHLALEDMSAAEEDMLENAVIFKLRIDKNQQALREIQVMEQDLRRRLGGRPLQELDLDDPDDRALFMAIQQNNTAIIDINKDLKELSVNFQNIQKHLNVSREQREQKRNIGADTFLSLIKKFNDRDIRESIGKYNERMRIATEKKLREFKKSYEFLDGTTEPIILDGADFQKKDLP